MKDEIMKRLEAEGIIAEERTVRQIELAKLMLK
jgi:hypothetical protein